MKAVILAAGRGTRIRSAHGERPKCLIALNGDRWNILDQQILSLFSVGIRDIAIVVGYEKDQVRRHVMMHYGQSLDRFTLIENPRFAETNNIYSLWLARDWLKSSSFVVLNADVAFDKSALRLAVRSAAPITMIIDRAWRDETMKVVIRGSRVTRMSKQITKEEFSATYIGVTVFDSRVAIRLFGKLDALISAGQEQVFFNVGVQQLADEGVRVGYADITGLAWAEIDDPGDLAFARSFVFPKLAGLVAAA